MGEVFKHSMEINYYTAEIDFFLSIDPALTTFCHGNLAPDNAWYWRDADGFLNCGLLDFGGCGIGNLIKKMPWSWLMAEPVMLQKHFDDLTQAIVDGVQGNNGPSSITFDLLSTYLSLVFAWQVPHTG